MTIEERAKDIYYNPANKEYWSGEHYNGLMKIATDQQKIDIEKACRLFNNFIDTLVLTHPNKIMGADLGKKQFKQAMEEEQ